MLTRNGVNARNDSDPSMGQGNKMTLQYLRKFLPGTMAVLLLGKRES